MDEQRIELKSLEQMLGQFGITPDILYPPLETTAFGVYSSTTNTSTYSSRDVQMFQGEGYEQVVSFDTWTSPPSATFLPPHVMSSTNFFPDSYSHLVSSNYCCSNDTVQHQDLVSQSGHFGNKEDGSTSTQ